MGIDVKEWARLLHEVRVLPIMSACEIKTQWTIDLINAVLDDRERAKADPQQTGDVPEWFSGMLARVYYGGQSRIDTCITDEWRIVEAELARRVAEATAGRDAEIVRLKKRLEPSGGCRILSIGDECNCTLCKQDAEIAKLKQECTNRKEIEDTLAKRIDEERANVERIKAELAEATKPVSGSPEWTLAKNFIGDVPVVSYETLKIERNAREAAEERERELREFARTKRIMLHGRPSRDFFIVSRDCTVTDAELDELLAAFRAAKAGGAG